MDNNNKEYIIKIQLDNGEQGTANTGTAQNAPNSPNSATNDTASNNPSANKKAMLTIKKLAPIISLGKTAVNFAGSNIGNFTGSSRTQETVNTSMKIMAYTAMIASRPVSGSIAVATDITASAITYSFNQKWKEKEIEQAKYKVGYSARNRSR